MKKCFKFIGFILLGILVVAYLAFLFVLPRKVDLNAFKSDVQKLVLEQAHMNIDFSNAKVFTTPILEAGAKIDGIKITLLDGSELFSADGVKVKLSLPNLLLLTVRVSEIAVDNPKVNVEIEEDGSQYKVMQIVENIINEQKQKQEVAPQKPNLLTKLIKIKVPNVKVNDYSVLINDLQSKHYLTLRGGELRAAYNNMKTFKVKTEAEFLSDEDVNITAKVDINSFIPPAQELDEDDDPDYRADMAFVNPVLLYRDYDLKTNVDAKLKARQKRNGQVTLKGHLNVEDLTMNLSGYQLPESYFRAKFKGNNIKLNTNIYVAEDQNIFLSGLVNYGKHPRLNLTLLTKKIYFNDLVILTKAFTDTLHIKNDLASLKAQGYLTANARIKTNFKKIKSNGAIVVRDGNISNEALGLLFKDINANVLFDDKTLKISDTYLYINDAILRAQGQINEKSVADISLYAEKLPLPGLFAAFAPVDAKKALSINSGDLFLDVKLVGELKKAISNIKVVLSNLDIVTKDNSLRVTDGRMDASFASNFKTISGKVANEDLKIYLTPTNSIIANPALEVIVDERDLKISPLQVFINKASEIVASGYILDYTKKPLISFSADGDLVALDLKQILGAAAEPFVKAQGRIPFKFVLDGTGKRQDMICQIKADKLNYITPVDVKALKDLQSLIQAKITFKGDRLNIKDTGLYVKQVPTVFGNDFDANMEGAKEVAVVSGTITKLNTPTPFINQINVVIPEDLEMGICAFKDSVMTLGGKLLVFGQALSPKYRGEFGVWDLNIPELYTSLKTLNLEFLAKTLYVKVEELLLNGSDIEVSSSANLAPASILTVYDLQVNSENFDVPKVMQVSEAAMKFVPSAQPSSVKTQPADIPLELKNGAIDFKRISSPPILLANTTGKISLNNNVFYLQNLDTSTLGGKVTGEVSANLLNMLLGAKLKGEQIDVETAFLDLMNMKDTLSGTASFETDLVINAAATDPIEQMKGISGSVDFRIVDGQLGPFGKLENLILAENIRESKFFQTALGGVINSLTSIQTSHFDDLNGHIVMGNGIAQLNPITSVGPVMCMNISGDMNLLNNEADMTLRARLGSKIADMLGPIAAVNPINLVKATPGLNVAAAKMFAFFCEEVTQEEMDQIPDFKEEFGAMSTTNFQVVLRGDTQKPLSLIDSFNWLTTVEDMQAAQNFVSTLPPVDENNPNATLEELLAAQAEAEIIANENIFQKGIRKIKNFFSGLKKEEQI